MCDFYLLSIPRDAAIENCTRDSKDWLYIILALKVRYVTNMKIFVLSFDTRDINDYSKVENAKFRALYGFTYLG